MTWYKDFDWVLMTCWIFLTAIGLTAIYSATQGPVADFLPANIQQNFNKQFVWASISLVCLIVLQFTAPRTFQQVSYVVYAVALLLSVATLFWGVEINGAKSWLEMGGIRIQTSEFLKLGTILAVANFLTSRRNITAVRLGTGVTATLLILIPVIIILLQNDTGTALVFLPLIPVMLFLSGLPYGISLLMIAPALFVYLSIIDWFWGALAVMITGIIIYLIQKRPWLTLTTIIIGALIVIGVNVALNQVLQPHQQNRIEAFLNPQMDPHGAGWNVIQAKTAIGSGGLYGKGFMQGTQTQLRFLPEQWTDFIFCVIGEEWGFMGAGLVVMLLLILIMRLMNNAVNIKNPFSQLVFVGIATILFMHVLINLGSTMGLMPIIGLPLPFLSYGGSSFLTNTLMIGISLNMYLYQRALSMYGNR